MTRPLVNSIAVPVLLVLLPQAAVAGAAHCPALGCPQRMAQAATPPGTGPVPAAPPPDATSPGTAPPPAPAAPATPTPAPPPPAQATLPTPSAPAPGTSVPALGTLRNANAPNGTSGGIDPQYYGNTLSSAGRPQGGTLPAYGGTQRNTGLSDYNNAPPLPGTSPYGGTQSTIGTPQYNGTATYGAPQGAQDAQTGTRTRSLTGTTLPGNVANNSRAPLGSAPITRDQIGSFGGRNGYTAQGVYTGVAGQTVGYGQPYATAGRPVGGLLSTGADATGPLRPYVPLDRGRAGGPTNSGYGIPNGSRPTTMDGRGVQRIN